MTTQTTSDSPHLTVAQLANRWHTTKQAIYTARHRGKAPKGFKRGVGLLFPLSEVLEFEAGQMAADKLSNRHQAAEHRPSEPRRARRKSASQARVPVHRTAA